MGTTRVVVVDKVRLVKELVVDVERGWEDRVDVSTWMVVSVPVSAVVEESGSGDAVVDQEDGVQRSEGVGGVSRVVVEGSWVFEGGASISEVEGRVKEDVSSALTGATARANVARRKRL